MPPTTKKTAAKKTAPVTPTEGLDVPPAPAPPATKAESKPKPSGRSPYSAGDLLRFEVPSPVGGDPMTGHGLVVEDDGDQLRVAPVDVITLDAEHVLDDDDPAGD